MSGIELDALLAPITEDSPAGEDIRENPSPNSIYRQIKDARSEARSAERNMLFMDEEEATKSKLKSSEEYWQTIEKLSPEILKNHAKDLEIASWYTESLLRSRHYHSDYPDNSGGFVTQFSALNQGFKLILEMINQYWDNLYPLPDEDGLETKVAPLSGLNGEGGEGTLIAPLRNLFIGFNFTYWDALQAREDDSIADEEKREKKIKQVTENGGWTMTEIRREINNTPPKYYECLVKDIESCISTFSTLDQTLYERCQEHAPPTRNITETLEAIRSMVKTIAEDRLVLAESTNVAMEPADMPDQMMENSATSPQTISGTTTGVPGFTASHIKPIDAAIQTREEALKQLLLIAEFFHKTEPHSPVSYSLKKTVRWAKMPLDQLLRELIPDESMQESLSSLTGVKIMKDEDDDDY